MTSDASIDRTGPARWQRRSLGIGVFALVVCAAGGFWDPGQFFRAYLAAYVFFLGIGLGSLAVLMIYHLTGGAWGLLIRRPLEAAMRTLPLLAVLFLPIALGIGYLYVWARPEAVASSAKLQYQQFYLNPQFFWIRAAAYFLVWLAIALVLGRWSRQEDESGDPRLAWKSRQLSAFGAVAYGISIHFASVDWVMSLEPVFHSTIWGPLFAFGQLLSGLAVALIVFAREADRPPVAEMVSLKAVNDLGSLLFTFLVAWAYMAWFQFMLVWIANLPVDVVWYLPRLRGAWLVVTLAIVLLHFVVPFFLLLARPVKRNPRAVARIAALILVMQLAFMYYQVMPSLEADGLAGHWMDFLTPIGVGGVWLAVFLWQLGRHPVLARHDYNRASALYLRRLDEEEAAREEAAQEEAPAHG
jgi:hypothetical protein